MDTRERLELLVGQTHTVRLRGLGPAGYAWEVRIEGDAGVVEVSIEREREGDPVAPGGPPPGATAIDRVATIHALAPGTTTVTLTLRRPWETTKPSLEAKVFDIAVAADRAP